MEVSCGGESGRGLTFKVHFLGGFRHGGEKRGCRYSADGKVCLTVVVVVCCSHVGGFLPPWKPQKTQGRELE